jgi:hypothetical protein
VALSRGARGGMISFFSRDVRTYHAQPTQNPKSASDTGVAWRCPGQSAKWC